MAGLELVAMRNRKTVSLYVEEADKSRIERESEQAGLSQSEYIKSILRQHWNEQDTDEAADKMDAEEKIERAANQALREIEDATRHTEQRVDALADIVARSGSYSVANFELLKHQHGPPEGTKTDALQVGSRRLRAPLSDHPDLLDGDGDSEDDQDESAPLTVEDTANADGDDDDEGEDESSSVTDHILKDRGRSKEEAEKTRW
jgi:predicted DNA-binding protein